MSLDLSKLYALVPQTPIRLHSKKNNFFIKHGDMWLTQTKTPTKYPDYARKYIPSDPINSIDWKAYARSDQLFIRETNRYTTRNILIVVDASVSMMWPDDEIKNKFNFKQTITKFELALRVAFNLAFAHLKNIDKVKFLIFENTYTQELIIKNAEHILELFGLIQNNNFNISFIKSFLRHSAGSFKNNGNMIYLLTDGLCSLFLEEYLNMNATKKVFFHILSSYEKDISWIYKNYNYFDVSNVDKLIKGAHLIHNNNYYLKLDEWIQKLQKMCLSNKVFYALLLENLNVKYYQDIVKHI